MALAHSPRIVTDGLVLCLDAANPKSYPGSDTTWTDLSGNENNGTLVNGVGYSADNKGTMVFDGVNDYVDLPNSLGYTNQVSAFSWFKSNGTPLGDYHIILGGQELEISIPTAGQIRTGVVTNTRFVSNHGSGVTDGNWHYVGFTYNSSLKISYIDGLNVGTQSTTGSLTNTFSARRMGRFGTSTQYYANSNISSVHIYDRALTAQEIQQNFNALRGRYGR